MTELLQTIISKVKESDPLHAKKLRKNIENADSVFLNAPICFLTNILNIWIIKIKIWITELIVI